MKCLSQRQLARLALGLTLDGELTAHSESCRACRAGLTAMQAIRRELAVAYANLDEGHEAARERLLAILPAPSRPPKRAKHPHRMTQWIGGLTMRQRMALGGVGVATALGLLLAWATMAAKPVSAMERMAASIRQAKSIKATDTIEETKTPEPGKPPIVKKSTGTIYWLAPGLSRCDMKGNAMMPGPSEKERQITQIDISEKPRSIMIDHTAKTYTEVLRPKGYLSPGPEIFFSLGEMSGQADRDLGTKEISGKNVRGFEIDGRKLFKMPLTAPACVVEVWLDRDSNLPFIVELRISLRGMDRSGNWTENTGVQKVVLEDFQWNVDLDPKLFDTTMPEGYRDETPKEPSVERRVWEFTEGLKAYAELTGGRYPPTLNTIDQFNVVHKELLQTLGFKDADWRQIFPPEVKRDPRFPKIERAAKSLITIASLIQFNNADATYQGKTVEPKDKEKVLLRWKLDDGRYEVIFGDLRAETVSAERLHILEGK